MQLTDFFFGKTARFSTIKLDLNKIDKDILKSTVESIGDKKTYKVENIKISL